MSQKRRHGVAGTFKRWALSWKTLASALLISLSTIYLQSEWNSELRERTISTIDFKVREKLSREQAFSDKLKVLIYGDKAKREFGVQELISTRQWADFIAHVASRQPRAIIFDKMFTFSLGGADDLDYFHSTLSQLKTPVIAAGTFNEAAISEGQYNTNLLSNWRIENSKQIPTGRLSRFIGPAKQLRDSITKLGGAQLNNSASVYPAWIDRDSSKTLPHLSLSFFPEAEISNNQVRLESSTLFLDRHGRIPVNFINTQAAYSRFFLPMSSIFRLGAKSPVLSAINENDVVLVLPAMYTGSTDFKTSPIGRIAGGVYHASIMNSALINTPIIPIFNSIFSSALVFIAIALCVWVLSSKLSFITSVLTIVSLALAIIIIGLFAFAFGNIQSDWHAYSFFAAVYGGGLLSLRAAKEEKRAQFTELLLEGMVSKDVLKKIKYKPEIWKLRPKEQSMTVMFIDIEGFSLRTKELFPVDMFSILHTQINTISSIVHEHGGIVDRVLGDGMLCFFGFSFDEQKGEVQFDHALRALKCALTIQSAAVHMTTNGQASSKNHGSILPLRIGLCTGDTFIGNMGTDRRLDFTVIGHTVNMAKRYEDACETFRVFMSEATFEELRNREQLQEFNGLLFVQRYMSMKHHLDLVLGWECDPFSTNKDVYNDAMKIVSIDTKKTNEIQSIRPKQTIKVRINQNCNGTLKAFDTDKYIIDTDIYFCRKVNLVIELIADTEDTNVQLTVANLKILHFQVSLGQALSQNEFRHELQLLNVTTEKRRLLNNLLTQEA